MCPFVLLSQPTWLEQMGASDQLATILSIEWYRSSSPALSVEQVSSLR